MQSLEMEIQNVSEEIASVQDELANKMRAFEDEPWEKEEHSREIFRLTVMGQLHTRLGELFEYKARLLQLQDKKDT